MAKKKKDDNIDDINIDGLGKETAKESTGSKIVSFLIALVIVIIWLGVFALLIKLDVGGFGSNVLSPILKDVPIINKILPDSNYEDKTGEAYGSLDEAVAKINELQAQIDSMNTSGVANSDYITELETENERLKQFEQQQKDFEARVREFDEKVVFNDNAPDINEYKTYYEQIEPENAAEIYKQVIEQIQANAIITELAEQYSNMDAASAAEILETMTGDLDLVSQILSAMKPSDSAKILQEMSAEYAAKVTKRMTLPIEDGSN